MAVRAVNASFLTPSVRKDAFTAFRSRLTIRVRLTALAVLIVAVGLVAGSAIVLALVEENLLAGAENAARQRASDTAALVAAGAVSSTVDNRLVQVVDRGGQVLAASPELRGRPPLLSAWPTPGPLVETVTATSDGESGEFLVVAVPTTIPLGASPQTPEEAQPPHPPPSLGASPQTPEEAQPPHRPLDGSPVAVYAASSLETVTEGVDATASALLIAVPVLLVIIGAASWLLVGRTLRPVEAMRRQVAEITADDLDRRVPEPPAADELGRLASTMNAMLARLQQAHELEHRFAGDAAHELRSPLAAILTQLEVGLAHPADTDWLALARSVHREGTRLDRLTDELLTLSRADDHRPFEPVDLDELVLSEVDLVRARGRVSVDLSALSAARLPGRPEDLRRVIRNLLDNAERHAASVITVGLTADTAVAELVIADDGDGIPEADRAAVFTRFHRLQPARDRDTGGAGLGLAIARGIVEAHGGRIWAAPAPGGADLHVRLPLHAQQ
jgi:signal transduction histidine kinase